MTVTYNPNAQSPIVYELADNYINDPSIIMKDIDEAIARIAVDPNDGYKFIGNQLAPLTLDGSTSLDIPEIVHVISGGIHFIRTLLTGVTSDGGGVRIQDGGLGVDITLTYSQLVPSDSTNKFITTIILTEMDEYKGVNSHVMYEEKYIERREVCQYL